MPQTKREIVTLLEAAGAKPNRRLGQHFLIDGNLMRKLVEAAEIPAEAVVLEVGPGTGSLTEMLVERAGYVVAVEADRTLAGIVRERLGDCGNLTLVEGDALANKNRLSPELVTAVRNLTSSSSTALLLVANLPYQIASPLVIDLLLSDLGVQRLCFSVQKEVAERIASPAGRKSYGPLSIIVQALCEVRHVAELPASVFWPRPQVASSMLRLDVDAARRARIADVPRFVNVVRTAFQHRRKTLMHALGALYGEKKLDAESHVALDAFDLSRRPEQLAVDEWIALAARLPVERHRAIRTDADS
jgi:16S rRNA (adenine1518-N6/adenine1519-N6)-dimethyltransferase